MEYSNYREPVSMRSPVDRSSWDGRDDRGRDDRDRSLERSGRRDSFYRGRSPAMEAPRRRRSRSPDRRDHYSKNEYDRRDDYRDSRNREDRRRPSPGPPNIDRYIPGQDSTPKPIAANPLPDPSKLNYQVGFSYFGEWWRGNERIKEDRERLKGGRGRRSEPLDRDAEKALIQSAYDNYKEELQARMAKQFVTDHKAEQWFLERYVPEVRDPLKMKMNEFRRGNYSQWEQDLEAGTFDKFSLEGIPKSESNGQGGIVEKEEGEATAVNEVLGVGDLLPLRDSDIRDESAFQPTLLIKTIAPHVNREKLEQFCKEHLGEEEGGFKWLSLSDPNPSKRFHRIGWVMLHPTDESKSFEDRPEPTNDEDEGEAKAEPKLVSTAEKALETINGQTVKDETRGDFTCHVGIHVPPQAPRKKALWDLFSAPERIERDVELATGIVNKFEEDFGADFNAVMKIEERVEDLRAQGQLTPALHAKQEKVKKDENFDEDMEEGEEGVDVEDEEEGVVDEEVDDESLLVKKKQLDLMVEYLRRVFNFCFFCVFESDSIHELTRKCPGGHLRRPRNTLTPAGIEAARASAVGNAFPGRKRSESPDSTDGRKKDNRNSAAYKAEQQLQRAFNWVSTYEEKILQILKPENIDVRKLGGEPIESALEQELMKYVKQETEQKFRCRVPDCVKMFKEEHFWRKHVEKRHEEWLANLKKDLELVNTYVCDPAHIAPSRSDANSNGHFPPANGHLPAGTPRGFNLNTYGSMPQMGFPAFFAGHPVSAPPGWAGTDGAMRRGGGRFSNTRGGPYDRPGGRDQRWANNGRLSPTSGRAANTRGRYDTGAASQPGPREAVQGRSLKSYEDLDAVAGAGAGELNY